MGGRARSRSRHTTARRAFLTMRYAAPADGSDAMEPAARFLSAASWRADLLHPPARNPSTGSSSTRCWRAPTDGERGAITPAAFAAAHLLLVANAAYRQVAGSVDRRNARRATGTAPPL